MKLGVVIADTFADRRAARFAVERTLHELPVDDCLVVSDHCFVEGARHVPIAPLAGLADYNALMLDALAGCLRCDTYLVIQWDGFVIDGRRWERAYTEHDYIGAPWPHRGGAVGAGGFSLRSRRLIDAVSTLRRAQANRDVDTAEDLQLCTVFRAALQAAGLRFAAPGVASRFAFERTGDAVRADCDVPQTLGFHGVFNFPLVLAEQSILGLFGSILARMPATPAIWLLFVWHAWQRGYDTLGIKLLAALAERDPRSWAQVAQACVGRGISRRWLSAAA